jgi:hypothetical protein
MNSSIPLALIGAMAIGCQSQPAPGSLADIKRAQERKLFSECIAEHHRTLPDTTDRRAAIAPGDPRQQRTNATSALATLATFLAGRAVTGRHRGERAMTRTFARLARSKDVELSVQSSS